MASRKLSPSTKSNVGSRPCSPQLAVSVEQAFLETYFLVLSQFGFDKAKDLALKEKESNLKKGQLAVTCPWLTLINNLCALAEAEKTYSSCSFLVKKRFRKDSLLSDYQTIECEVEKLSGLSSTKDNEALMSDVISRGLLAELCRHLTQFVQARQQCMKIYENLATLNLHTSTSNPVLPYSEIVQAVMSIRNANIKKFHHPILDPVKTSFSVEMDLLHHLLQAQCDLVDWKFLPSLLHLHESKAKLLSWNKTLPSSSVRDSFTRSLRVKKRFSGGSRRQIEVPLLFQWLARFHASLVSKFSLYFHATLSEQSSPVEMKTLVAKTSIDYVNKINTFCRRSDASYIILLLDTRGLSDSYKAPGYHLPRVKVELPTGIHSYPSIFSHPNDCPKTFMPSIVSLIQDNEHCLSQEKIVYFFDERSPMTYFLANADHRMTLVVIFKCKKNERDSYVVNFLQDVTNDLRNVNILSMLTKAT
ncbi:KICSTOR subunit 2-like [Xenia sp. Carnegie-2017]|uniref:KICSTOR subunit 2-like n=1 Tax=Xenia sp. Carnegie-2017 TaxID=2897299 RepID=UPI001F05047C|nr:KICSTOR subunit 2-like [Xenia sp. Carnegie-2017]